MFWNKKAKAEESDLDPTMIEIGREVERGFVLQHAMITVFWEQEGNLYWESMDAMMKKMLDDKTLTDADRLYEAKKIQGVSQDYRWKVTKVMSDYENFILNGLAQFEEMLGKPPLKIKSCNKGIEWLKLSRDLCKSRAREITAMNTHIDTDEFIPAIIIENKGEVSKLTVEDQQYFAEACATYGTLRKITHDEEKQIEPKRSNIAESMFGRLNDYLKNGSYSRLVNEMRN